MYDIIKSKKRGETMETKDILKSLRKSKGFSTMQEFCTAAEISFSTYQNYETGKRIPTAEILIKLADFYGVTTDYLLGRDKGEPSPLDRYAGTVNMSDLEREIIDGYFTLDDKTRKEFMTMLETAVKNVQDGNGEEVFRAAKSDDNHPGGITKLTKEQAKRIKNAPRVTSETDDF